MAQKIITQSESQTQDLAKKILSEIKTGKVITLSGELGSGKTTFTQGLGDALGVSRITSPTYTIIHEHLLEKKDLPFEKLYHIDLYRLESTAEILDLGLNEIWFNPKNLIVIEWPEIILNLIPKPFTQISLKKLSPDQREITIV